MNLSDTFYVALCMTVLILGVVYWFWTQNQYIQRKLNLLENIVYEMKSGMNSGGPPDIVDKVLAHADYLPIGSAHSDDHDHGECDMKIEHESVDDVLNSLADEAQVDNATSNAGIQLENVGGALGDATGVADGTGVLLEADEVVDLQPGGVITSGADDVSDLNNESVLNGMGLKELKTLATQKGIAGAKNMRKQDLVAAIRASKTSVTPFEVHEGTLTLN
jgi:hypothetical protein